MKLPAMSTGPLLMIVNPEAPRVRVRLRVLVLGHLLGYGHENRATSPQRCRWEHMSQDLRLLDHEKLDVYKLSLTFLAHALRILDGIPRQRRELRSQLERAAMSISLNIAEGCGKPTPADRARYHGIARGSALECGALLDVCGPMGHATVEQIEGGQRMAGRVVAMLTRMCR